jgi:hypothetical protein
MNVQVRLTRALYERIHHDLERPHAFAAERVGFVRAKLGNRGGDPLLILLTEYVPVPDDQYVVDPFSGARIDGAAIRGAMQDVLTSGSGMFHVHMHPHVGSPALSRTDVAEIPRLIASLRNAGPTAAHGIFLLSLDKAVAFVWAPGEAEPIRAAKVAIVGYPMELMP